ncbi:peptidase M42 family protein [Nitrosococcus halophilus Nc 4]|uniref:Peptidase M42 family protein n=1 Tax=Nitrosococcus halophilus (strain Nc4) TaxID=472759 RepID=D5C4I4_NITHN|nr:M20/M25/M40 family metallo-hydrolase [Nitrosococcus halophilus]ADE15168.1 peptidase M42 family protein [Nitrosococcus halophilus Nc 4]
MDLISDNQLFCLIEELVLQHSPSGAEQEIDGWLLERFATLGQETWQDAAGNLIVKVPGKNPGAIAITAHKDEIGAIVKSIDNRGRVEVRKLGGAFPWVYGEGVVDLLGDHACISGILSFGSRHVSHEAPQKAQQDQAPLQWQNAWVETKCTPKELDAAGVRPGTRMVVGKHRKRPFRLKDYIASYTLDNKASVAILLELARNLQRPLVDIYLVASAKEEVGAIGALYFSQRQALDALIALEICPLASEYVIKEGSAPVLLSQDGYGLYDEGLNGLIRQAATRRKIPLQLATINGFGSDGSIAMKYGHVPRAACLGFPTQNTHGYEIAHLGAIIHCIEILYTFCTQVQVDYENIQKSQLKGRWGVLDFMKG